MSDIVIADSHFKFFGKCYFRGGAPEVKLGDFGEKRSPITKINRIDVQGCLPIPKLKIQKATVVEIDFSKTKEKDLLANINVAAIFKASPKTAYQDMVNHKMKLVLLTADNTVVEKAVNESPNVLDKLKEYGNDARVVGKIILAMDVKTAQSFDNSTSIGLSVNAGVVKITADLKFGSSGNNEYTLSDGTTFAYGLLKPHWDAARKKNRNEVEKFTDDDWGL